MLSASLRWTGRPAYCRRRCRSPFRPSRPFLLATLRDSSAYSGWQRMNDTDSHSYRLSLGPVVRAARAWSLAAWPLAAGAGGGSDKPAGAADSVQPQVSHIETIEHEACKESGNRVEALDSNGDGKPD